MKEQNDSRARHCPMLGHEITFSYCRAPGADSPCRKILDCWFERFEVEEYVRNTYGEKEIVRLHAPAPDRMTSLLDIIKKAQENVQKAKENES